MKSSNMYATVSLVSRLRDGSRLEGLRATYMVASVAEESELDVYWKLFSRLSATHKKGIRVVVVRMLSVPEFLLGPPASTRLSERGRWMHDGRAENCVFAYSEPLPDLSGKRTVVLEGRPRERLDEGVEEIAVGNVWGDVLGGSLWVNRVYVQNSPDSCRSLIYPDDTFCSWQTWSAMATPSLLRVEAHGREIPVATYFDGIRLPSIFACVSIRGSVASDHANRFNTPHGLATDPRQLIPMLTALKRMWCRDDRFCAIVAVPAVSAFGICVSSAVKHRFPGLKVADACGLHYAPIVATTFTRHSTMLLSRTVHRTSPALCVAAYGNLTAYSACAETFAFVRPYGVERHVEAIMLPTKMGTTPREFLNLFFTGPDLWQKDHSAVVEKNEHERGCEILDRECRKILVRKG